MTLTDFKASVVNARPPVGIGTLLQALWHSSRGEWDAAHELAQDVGNADGSWVHAHLHRQEGDLGNAGYWYRRAGRPVATGSLDDEWNAIAANLLEAESQ